MHYLLAFTLLLAPTYIVRFNVAGLPTNVLMVWLGVFWLIFAGWLTFVKNWPSFFISIKKQPRMILILVGSFFLAGLISLFVGGITIAKFGQFIVLFLQPVGTYFMARYLVESVPRSKELLIRASFIFLAAVGTYAVVQYFTLIGLPEGWWGNSSEPKRAIAFFAHPNGLALFVTPLLALLLPKVSEVFDNLAIGKRKQISKLIVDSAPILAWIIGALGLLLSLSRGGWLGLIAALAIFVVLSGKKNYWYAAIIGIVLIVAVVVAVPNLRYRVMLPFYGEKSSVARLSLWQTGSKMILDNPFLGKGLLGFTANWDKYNTDPGLQSYPAPHNIFLNFWVDTGLLGVLSFTALNVYILFQVVQRRQILWSLAVGLFIVAIFVHGQIDVPYLKNDLALLYWLIIGAFYVA